MKRPPGSTGHVSKDQGEVFAFLADPATYHLAGPITVVGTHAAAVFLAGPDAYKVKRAIKFPFLDLSTLTKRRRACEAEVEVNRRYAPDLYLGIVPVTRHDDRLQLGGDGPIVEWAVHLKRFDETRTLDHLAERRELGPDLLRRLTDTVLETYAKAEIRDGERAIADLEGVVDETVTALAAMPELFPPGRSAAFADSMRTAFASMKELLLCRGRAGRVRRCHGDLHLRNIVLIDDVPTFFDAIEFDESIATTDVLYDFAFLLMDLWEGGFKHEASIVFNRYLWWTPDQIGELAGLAALPLFLALRAAVRAKVDALRYMDVDRLDESRTDAQRYFAAAESFLRPAPAGLIAIGGLSGTGKSTLAALIAPEIGRAPGAVHLRSDIVRKRIFGVPELQRLPAAAYRRDTTERVFAELRDHAERAIRAGQSVIVDAVHRLPTERHLIADVARRTGAHFTGLWLDAGIPTLLRRVSERKDDASDATVEIVKRQAEEPLGAIEWTRLDASVSLDELARSALDLAMSRTPS